MPIEIVHYDEWKNRMNDIYLDVFQAERPVNMERCNFAIISKKENTPVGFVTCIEMDSETIYWQFGGALKIVKRTINVMKYYKEMISWCKSRYKRITTRIENDNIQMIKLAISCGFKILGTWNFNNKIYLELCCEFGG